jgi:Tfp pilus assembly protein PilX
MVMSNTYKHRNQQGIVSITVTVVLMIVISLIVLTFAKIIRREQRQALDRQLSTQAFYAAESGVNNVASAIKNNYTGSKVRCDTLAGNATIDNPTVNAAANVSVSCITINQSPDNLYYSSVDQTSTVIPLQSGDGSNLSAVTLKWQAKSTNSNVMAGCEYPNFPANNAWNCPLGLMRVDIVPTAGTFTRTSLNTNMFSAFLYPSSSGLSTFDYSTASGLAGQGGIIQTQCSGTPITCSMAITGLGSSMYTMRVRSLYVSSTLTVTATSVNSGSNNVALANAQAIVDSTGKASDVLRRIQVRVPLSGVGGVPDYGLQTNKDICKRYMYVPGSDVIIDPLDGASCGIN